MRIITQRDKPLPVGTKDSYLAAHREFLGRYTFSHFVTVNPVAEVSMESFRRRLKHFHAMVDRKLLGKFWLEYPERRTFFFAYFQNDPYIHVHLLVKVLPEYQEEFEALCCPILRKLFSSTKAVQVERLRSQERCGRYVSRDAHMHAMEGFIVSPEFVERR